jgi:phosphate transport system protein
MMHEQEIKMTQHTVKAFDLELGALSQTINEMGGITEAMLTDAVDALARCDLPKAKRVVSEDAKLDVMQREVEERAVLLIAKRQPMANDLRHVMGTIRIASDLERVGDLLKNIGKRVNAMGEAYTSIRMMSGIQNMSHLVAAQLKSVLDSFAQNNAQLAEEVWRRDGEVDAMHNSLFRELLTYMMEDPRSITFCTHLLFTAKNIERVGDHATNIAETVYFIETGSALAGPRPKLDTTALMASLSDD